MSPYFTQQQDTLFYVDFDQLIVFVTRNFSPCFTIRNDYTLPDYTLYIYQK